jgi:hypothetical protein
MSFAISRRLVRAAVIGPGITLVLILITTAVAILNWPVLMLIYIPLSVLLAPGLIIGIAIFGLNFHDARLVVAAGVSDALFYSVATYWYLSYKERRALG